MVKIIGVTTPKRVSAAPDAKTMMEQGIDTTFVTRRGSFGAPDLPADKVAADQDAIAAMDDTAE